MQPFGIPKNPKMSVQTRKQPPVQRYPNPYSTPSQPKTNAPGSGQKKIGANPFAEENNSTTFDIAQSFGVAGGFEESEGPLQTPERFNSDGFNQHHRGGMNFEETPAALARGGDLAGDEGGYLEDQSVPDNERNESQQNVPITASPDKRNLRGRDDDEYVRVESADELEEEPHIRNKNEIPRGTPAKLSKAAGYGSANKENVGRNTNPAGYEEDHRRTQHHGGDSDALLQIKRLELELAKERQRADFFEGEQNKLISENTELRRRTEELNAKVDLAKRYDTSERLAKKEEEVERLKIEVNSLSEERTMLDEHYRRLLNENRGFRTESDSLIYSVQEENRRLQEEVQNLRQEMEVRVASKITVVNEKNVFLENEVTELRQQIQVLTDQLTLKANYDQKIAGFNQELDNLTANLSKTTSHTQTQVLPVHTQVSQTSPTKIHAMETQTQAQGTNVELHEAQTSPMKFPEQSRPQIRPPSVQTTSPTRFDNQGLPKSAIKISPSPSKPKYSGLNTPEIKTNPFGQPTSGSKLRPPVVVEQEAVHVEAANEEAQNIDFLESFKVEGEETVETPAYIPENVRNSPLYPPRAQASAQDDEESEDEIKQEERPSQIPQQDERPPIAINRSPLLRSPQQNIHPQTELYEKSSPAIPSPGQGGVRGLMSVPQYKVPQRPVPKKPAAFKPLSQASNPFADEGENVVETKQEEVIPPVFEQTHEELPPAQELVHHINPTTDQQEPIHSTFEEKPPVITQKNDEMPPPRNLMGAGPQTRIGGGPNNNIPINRPPLFNAQHRGKTQKIGKNPFSTEEPSTTSPALKVEETFEEQKQIPQPVFDQPPHESNEISNEAAENFFDQLAGGHPPVQQQTQAQIPIQRPPVTTTTTQPFRPGQPRFPVPGANQTKLTTSVSSLKRGGANPFAEEEAGPKTENKEVPSYIQSSFTQQDTTADLSKSFQSEEKAPEPGKVVMGKAVPLKKKKAALPGNMFD